MTAQPEFDLKNHVLVPIPYFHMLVQAYYGGPQKGKTPRKMESPASEAVEASPEFRDMVLAKVYPSGMEPRGVAARKASTNQDEEGEG